jgi:hypothetical protein
MKGLNLPTYSFKMKSDGNYDYIFDKYRKRYVRLTPEEWVRQNIGQYLEFEKGYPGSRIVLEKSLKVNGLNKRSDILIYDSLGMPLLLGECKAPDVKITNDTFLQASVYNYKFKVRYLLVTNGMQHYCSSINFETGEIGFLKEIPFYKEIDNRV